MRSPYYFWNALEEALGADFRAAISTMRLTEDKTVSLIPTKYSLNSKDVHYLAVAIPD